MKIKKLKTIKGFKTERKKITDTREKKTFEQENTNETRQKKRLI